MCGCTQHCHQVPDLTPLRCQPPCSRVGIASVGLRLRTSFHSTAYLKNLGGNPCCKKTRWMGRSAVAAVAAASGHSFLSGFSGHRPLQTPHAKPLQTKKNKRCSTYNNHQNLAAIAFIASLAPSSGSRHGSYVRSSHPQTSLCKYPGTI